MLVIVELYLECTLAYYSSTNEMKVFALTKDHKPSAEDEQKRIVEAGGHIYQ
jgi:serine/threonine protein phosphatase PrpC